MGFKKNKIKKNGRSKIYITTFEEEDTNNIEEKIKQYFEDKLLLKRIREGKGLPYLDKDYELIDKLFKDIF